MLKDDDKLPHTPTPPFASCEAPTDHQASRRVPCTKLCAGQTTCRDVFGICKYTQKDEQITQQVVKVKLNSCLGKAEIPSV